MNIKQLIALFILAVSIPNAFGQKESNRGSLTTEKTEHSVTFKHSIGASLLMISNLLPDPADYYLFTYGYTEEFFPGLDISSECVKGSHDVTIH